MHFVYDVIKGVLIGVANIIPGVSGGTMAVSMGIYDKLIYAVTHLLGQTKKSIQTLFPYVLGAGLGLVGLSFLIEYLFLHYEIPTNCFFIGLILGGLPVILKRIQIKKVDLKHALSFLIFFSLIIGLQLAGNQSGDVVLTLSLFEVIKLFFVGVIASATMVIPGVSGSMILMLLGYYQPILSTINQFMKALLALQWLEALSSGMLLLPFGIGIIIGIFAIAKLIEMLLAKYESITFCAILGLVVASPIAILMNLSLPSIQASVFVISFVTFILGCLIAFCLGKE